MTVSFAVFRKKASFLCGEETGPMCCDISPPKPLTSQQRTPSTASSSRVLTPRPIELNTSLCLCFPVVSPVALVSSSSIPSISQELDLVQISESLPTRGSSMVFSTAAWKSSKRTEFKVSTKDSECQSSAFSHIAHSISGIYGSTQRLRCRKKLHLGIRRRTEKITNLPQILVRSSHHLIVRNPGLPSRHNQKKTDDGKRQATRSTHIQGNRWLRL